MNDHQSGTFTIDARTPAPGIAELYQRRWYEHIGDEFALPRFTAATAAGLRGRFHATRVHDVVVSEVDALSAARTAGLPKGDADVVRLWVVHRGRWTLGGRRNGSEHTITPGGYLLGLADDLPQFSMAPDTIARVLMLPAAPFAPLLRAHRPAGPAGTGEVRLLLAHAAMVRRTLPNLGPAGVAAARDALVALASALVRGVTATGPDTAPALAEAARALAEQRLADPGLSPASLARELNVSVRTLQRAFAAEGGSVIAHIRRRRLEAASRDIERSRLSVAEIAARWQFADGSHLSRTFKQRYGRSPRDARVG